MQRRTIKPAVALVAGVLVLAATVPGAIAQQSTSAPQQTQTPPADDNSFPSDVSHKAADKKKADQQSNADAAADPDQKPSDQKPSDQTKTPPPPGDDGNAFPEETSRKAADAAKSDAAKDNGDAEGSSNSGVSSSSDYDRRSNGGRTSVPANVPMPHVDGKDPVKEDLNVGSYYLDAGNFAGAYLRYKDATTLAPENSDAIFGLAEAARHLKRRDEALANYQMFLQVVPSGSKAKDARKAVASLEKAK